MVGGAVFITANSSVHFEDGGWLHGNNAVQQGGAISLGYSAVLSMAGVNVDSNTVDLFAGGGISAGNGSRVVIDQSLVVNNTASTGSGGGIYGVGATIVVRGTSRVADNEAKVDGGGVCVVGYGTLEMDASSVTGNRAAGNGGGFAVSTGSEAALRNGAVLERNHGGDGGGVAVSEGRISIVDSAVRVNTAHGTASGVLLYGGAEMEVEGSRFELHPGSALKVVGEAQATVRSTIFSQNNGTNGGGLWADSSTAVMLDGCSFEHNVAEAGRGGAFYSVGNLTMTASLCVGNTAQQGGSAFLEFALPGQAVERQMADQQAQHLTMLTALQAQLAAQQAQIDAAAAAALVRAAMRDSQFWNNTALGDGAVFYMYKSLTESHPVPAPAQLADLHYEQNSAQGGGSIIFWDPNNLTASPQPPECLGCTEDVASAGNTAGYDSPSGWASRATGLRVAKTQAQEAGGYDLVHGIEVEVTDANEEVVTNAVHLTVKLLNSPGSPCTHSGDGVEQRVVNGRAVFRHDLQLVGAAGDTCLLRFTAELGVEGEVSSSDTAVPLRYCVPGEYPAQGHSSKFQKCTPCAANHISFSNDTACLECTEGVTCPGGDTYVVCPGHWLAPNAQYCQQHEDPTQCFLDRLYECGVKDACSSVEEEDAVADDDHADEDECLVGGRNNARTGSGIASVEGLALCNSDAYTEGVMCGGMTLVICAADHFPSILHDSCHQCPSRGASLSQAVLVTAVLGAVVVLLLMLYLRVSRTAAVRELQKDIAEDMNSGGTTATANQLNKARNALNQIIGYAQVMGQLTSIYNVEIIPWTLREFLGWFNLVNLDLDWMLNIPCFSHYFAPFLGRSSFWFAFWQSVATPALLCAFFAMVYLCLARLRALHQRPATEEAPSDVQAKELQIIELQWQRETKAVCIGATIFLLMIVYPGISTNMFQLFNCEGVAFDDEDLLTQM
eukprot:gene1883-biopygen1763